MLLNVLHLSTDWKTSGILLTTFYDIPWKENIEKGIQTAV